MWVILNNGTLYNFDKRRDRFDPTPFSHRLTDIQPAEDGRMLAATRDGQVFLIETINMTVSKIFDNSAREIRQILERKPGEYWIGTDNGLFVAPTAVYYLAYSYRTDGVTASVPLYDFSASAVAALGTYFLGSMALKNVDVATMKGTVDAWNDYDAQ